MAGLNEEPALPAGSGEVEPAPEVTFHFKVADRLPYVCRLLRKAHRAGVAATVVGDAATLDRLDRLLWTFDVQAFVPHVRVAGRQLPAPHLQATPLWLVDSLGDSPAGHRVLVQLGDALPEGVERFDRIHEVVDLDPGALEPARLRWRAHAAAGRRLVRHDASSAT